MDEQSAKRQGLEIHRRDMAFLRGFVTCTNCGSNYNASNPSEKTFCQMYSRPVNPDDTERNIFHAEACDQWVPDGLDRSKVVTPEHRYRYDD
jgi:hypothetical protein